MEDYSGLSSKVTVYAVSDDYSGNSMTNPMVPARFKPGSIEKNVLIKRHAIIGAGSVVLPGVVVGEGSSIGAMSLCVHDTEAWSINTGIPARKTKDREKKLLDLEKEFEKTYGNKF